MQCPACGGETPQGKRFCADCGAPLALRCSGCGAELLAGRRFCADCGAPVGGQPATPAAAAVRTAEPVAERRVCSVLFCDLVGFTPLSEARDPEEVRELLSRYFAAAGTVIGRYGGVVEKFIGDAVMAVWGAPTAAEGDAERAVRAALDVLDAVAELGRQVGVTGLAARAGVVTGEVAVTLGATGQGMVAGDPVNTAARVQATAEPGAVLVDEATWRLARSAVAFTAAGAYPLKGKAEPVALWRAERVVSGVGGSQRIDGLEAPLVGRDVELRVVKELFHACVERRSPRLVSVTGPAGVGKSRLGWEFEKYIDGLASVVNWHRGRCLSYGEGVAFWALAEMVRQRLGIAEEDPVGLVRTKLDDELPRLVAEPSSRDYIRPRLARLLGVDTDGAALAREELFAGWRLFFEQLAANRPVVLLVEDLQNADAGLLDFLEHLLDWARGVPVFVMTLARPELEDRRPGWGTGRRNGTTLALEPLSDPAMTAMLDALVPGMPAVARSAIAAQAQGIPLYAVETVRMLVDRDVVQPIDGVYRLVGQLGELAVPDTLQSLLAARLDALSSEARRLVADAAVLGSTFSADALVAVSGWPEEQVRAQLTELVHREVLAVSADKLSPERGQYGFVQNLFRQVAYDTLSRRERKARHLTVADHLARTFPNDGEEVSEVLAQHLLDALAAVPDEPDVPALRERAVGLLVRAAERAGRTGAPATAARLFRTAAGLREPAAAAAPLWERAGQAAHVSGDVASAGCYRRAGELYQSAGRPRDAARAGVGLGRALRVQGRHEQARATIADAVAALSAEPDRDTVEALAEAAVLAGFSGLAEEAGRLVQQAFDLAQAMEVPDPTITGLFVTSGLALTRQGRPVQAAAAFREAARRADLVADGDLAGRALLNLGNCLCGSDPPAAVEAAKRAVQHARRSGNHRVLPVATGNLAQGLLLTGDWAGAAATLDGAADDGLETHWLLAWCRVLLLALSGRCAEIAQTLPLVEAQASSEDPQDLAGVDFVRALAAACHGDHRAALQHGRSMLRHVGGLGPDVDEVRWGWPVVADAAFAVADLAEVDRLLDWLDGHPAAQVPRVLRAERQRVRARLLAARHDPGAAAAFDTALQALRDLGSPYQLACGLLDAADHLAGTGETNRAVALAEEAADIAERLGCGPLRDRASRLLRERVPSG